jgi:flavin-dependent dehydrogenase
MRSGRWTPEAEAGMPLENGSRIAVVGSGPAGSFFSYFLLKMARDVDLEVELDLWEPRSFSRCGPAGCNHCGGVVSETLVQMLAAEGIELPVDVVQRAVESYVIHMDAGTVAVESPVHERRIASLYRGNGPREGEALQVHTFDGYLQGRAVDRGARLVQKLVTDVDWADGRPHLIAGDGSRTAYDLVVVSTGVNSNLMANLTRHEPDIRAPKTARTYICEFRSTDEEVQRRLGESMHVFLVAIPRLEFAALIPKGECVTMCMVGDEIDQELIHAFLTCPEVLGCFPADATPCVCSCSPLINVGGTQPPFADRLVMIGDSGVTRLYKDGIGAAYRTAKAAASTAIFEGVSAEAFRRYYWPTCRRIAHDNAIGRLLFTASGIFRHSALSRRAVLRMTRHEQESENGGRPMSSILWNMFSGSAPYREILMTGMRPDFLGGLAWNVAASLRPASTTRQTAKAA